MFGVLSINKRNITYVHKWNPSSAIALAKNKYQSKVFFGERGIPVPETYALIESYQALLDHDFSVYPERFVVKPNKGSKGNGIMLVTQVDGSGKPFTSSSFRLFQRRDWLNKRYYDFVYPDLVSSDQYFRVGGVVYDELSFKQACARIFYGSYSLSRGHDAILVEECLVPGEDYKLFCEWGLADIRVIVFNRIPIAAMIRVPTELSGGRANIAQGGVACGINLATGKIDRLWVKGTVYGINHFPDRYAHFAHYRVPFWQQLLMYSSTIQYFSDLGYMGIDWILGDDGPILLEVNARPGLEIQNVTGVGLDGMMSKVADLTVHTPQKGVEIATSLFTPHEHATVTKHQHLYLSQSGVMSRTNDDIKHHKDVIVTVSLTKKYTYVSPDVADMLDGVKTVRLMTGDVLIDQDMSYRVDDTLSGFHVVLGTNNLQGFSIKPQHTMKHDVSFLAPGALKGDDYTDLQLLDQKLYQVAKQFSLSKILQPLNYLEEFDRFVDAKGSYNPSFIYDFPSKKKILNWKQSLKHISAQYRGAQQLVSPFGQMLYDYMDELLDKIHLIEAYKKQDSDAIRTYNERLYGAFDDDRQQRAMDVLRECDVMKPDATENAVILRGAALQAYVRKHLDDAGLFHVKVITDPVLASRIAVRLGSRAKVVFNPRAEFDRQTIDATLAHEVGVHVVRYLRGKETGWNILRKGTARYVMTEEGLALHAAEEIYLQDNSDYINRAIYQKYILSAQGHLSFSDMHDFLRGWKYNDDKSFSQLFRTVLRQKKGVIDTSNDMLRGRSKPKVYLDGYELICGLSRDEKERLMCGRVAMQYIDLFEVS